MTKVFPIHKSKKPRLPFDINHPTRFISNVETQMRIVSLGGHLLPMSINSEEYTSSYVCSPYTAFISYSREELGKVKSPFLEMPLHWFIQGLGMLLKWGQINRIVCLNNWLLSTNLYPHWEGEGIETTTSTFSKEYSSHGILFRSINAHLNRNLITRLKKNGYRLMPIRQVYIFDPLLCDYTRKQNFRWDARLLQQCKYRMVNAEDIVSEDYSRISELYNLLYIKKYSQHNPKFTSDYIKHCHLNGILELQGIRGDDGRLIGIVGSFDCGKVTTCPIVGYDTSISQKVGLYRMLMAMVMQRAAERGLILNLSAGAAHFKRIRGGKPFIEYIALYDRHLPFRQRLVWRLTALALDNIALPILQHYKL